MKQYTLTDIEYSRRKKKTRREEFLDTMNRMIPWDHWIDLIKPYYPSGKRGRPTRGIETMLRMYLMQNWFNLSDAGLEDAIYDSYAMRSFMNIDFYKEQVPDATTLLKFRHLLEEHHIGEQIFADVYHGMKIHAGVDAGSGYVHTITATSANVHDIDEAAKLIRDDDEVIYGDSGYSGMEKRPEIESDEHLSQIEYRINVRPSSIKISKNYNGRNWDKEIENRKSSTRCKVEHPFLIVKRQFGYARVVYRGLAKNFHRFNVLFACANIVMCARAGRMEEFCRA